MPSVSRKTQIPKVRAIVLVLVVVLVLDERARNHFVLPPRWRDVRVLEDEHEHEHEQEFLNFGF